MALAFISTSARCLGQLVRPSFRVAPLRARSSWSKSGRRAAAAWGAAAALAACVFFSADAAHAQATPVSGTGKGIAGGGLLGAEVVNISMGLAGVKPWWAYLLGGVGGAAAGATGGYFVEQADSSGQAPVYMLAGGLALVIPAVVVMLNATAFDPGDDNSGDEGTTVQRGKGRKSVRGAMAKQAVRKKMARPGALFGIDVGESLHRGRPLLTAGVPDVVVRPSFSQQERVRYGATASNDVLVPLVAASF